MAEKSYTYKPEKEDYIPKNDNKLPTMEPLVNSNANKPKVTVTGNKDSFKVEVEIPF